MHTMETADDTVVATVVSAMLRPPQWDAYPGGTLELSIMEAPSQDIATD